MRIFLSILFFILFACPVKACCENDSSFKKPSNKRLVIVGVGANVVYVGSMFALSHTWYKDQPKTKFHFFNDNKEWLQLDKVGHFTTAFHESYFAVQVLKWCGLSDKKAKLIGSMAGFIYQTPIEYFDGHSPEYGASWGDILANASGSALVLGQYLLWNEIRIQPKFSFHQTSYAAKRPNVLGEDLKEEIIKDYNGQTYWMSFNISSLFIKNKESKFPRWINVSLGYGGQDMLYAEKSLNKMNGYNPYRQYYLSFDIDFTHAQIKKKWIKYVLYPLNFIHIPFPALEFNKHHVKFHPFYF